MLKYPVGSRVKVLTQGKFSGLAGIVIDFKAINSAFPLDKTVWTYAIKFENGKTKWFPENFLCEEHT